MKNLLVFLIVLAFCLPGYGEVLVYRYSDQVDFFDVVEILEPDDPNDPNFYNWDVLIKDRMKGYLVIDANYNDFSIEDAALIAYWSNKGSATTGNPRGKFQETIELDNLELVRTTEYQNRNRNTYRWIFVDTQNATADPEILMVAGRAAMYDVGFGYRDKREIAKSMFGYVLGDSTEAGTELGQLQMGKVYARFDKTWTRTANADPNDGGFGGDFDDFINTLETDRKTIRGYLKKYGYAHTNDGGMLNAPEWVDVNDSDNNELFLDWTDVPSAKKYSVDIDGTITYFDPNNNKRYDVEVELSFGTSDRKDGGSMKDSDLTISIRQWDYVVIYALFDHGVDPMILRNLDGWQFVGKAKVKGLNPGKGNGRQNNPFSAWSEEFEVTWNEPD